MKGRTTMTETPQSREEWENERENGGGKHLADDKPETPAESDENADQSDEEPTGEPLAIPDDADVEPGTEDQPESDDGRQDDPDDDPVTEPEPGDDERDALGR